MAITKAKKVDITSKITASIENAVSVVFVRFSGLPMAETTLMRKALKDEGVGYFVAKKTLMRRVLAAKGYTGEMPELPGEIALAWSDTDATAAARAVFEQGKKKKNALTIVGGVFEGAFADAIKMQAIATIPSTPVLRGMFVNVINSPIQGLVIALNAIAEKKTA